jgi:putative transposase
MEQMARNAVDADFGYLRNQRYVLHDRDTKFCAAFISILESEGVECLALPPRSPNLKDYASHCTSCVTVDSTLLSGHRSESFMPWAFRGGWSPGCS